MNRTPRTLLHGAVAGILAATALAVWFLVVDWIMHAPLRTPAFLAGAILNLHGGGAIVGYTIFHYLVFIVIGVLASWVVGSVATARSILFGIVVGFLLFDLLFYAGIVSSGTNVIRALGWPEVLLGNIVAGLVMLAYLGLVAPAPARSWLQVMREHRTIREGLVAGLIGATAVAIWFLVVDAVGGRILFTPATLGSAFFFGATTPGSVTVDFATVAGYTLIHYAAFMIVGLIAAAVVRGTEDSPPLVLALALLFVVAETLFVGLVAIAANWILGTLAWWTVVVGNILAAVAMGVYLWKAHPALQQSMRTPLERPA